MDTDRELIALKNINLEIGRGEFFVFVGPSGSGKSTLLRIMSGLETEYQGSLQVDGITQSDMSFVFQQFALLPWMTAAENIALGLVARHVPVEAQASKVAQELKRFGLEKFAHSYPKELSGGMRQRVGIARAFATDPKIIFMDEAFSELDSFTAHELRQELLSIWQERRVTIVMVTHIIAEAIELADRIAVLTPRPGKIEAIVENDIPRPRRMRTEAAFAMEDKIASLIRP